jgi:hypothetical protein
MGRKIGTKWYTGQLISQIRLKILKTSNIYIGSMIQTDRNGYVSLLKNTKNGHFYGTFGHKIARIPLYRLTWYYFTQKTSKNGSYYELNGIERL